MPAAPSGPPSSAFGATPPIEATPPSGTTPPDVPITAAMVSQMWASMVVMSNNAAAAQAAVSAHALQPAAATFPAFVSSDASQAGKSIPNLFPTIETSTLLEIARHDFRPIDLCKLDSRFRNKADVERMESAAPRAGALKEYQSLHSLLIPLQRYFRVLQAFAMSANDAQATFVIGNAAGEYMAHIMELHQNYDWNAVIQYHMQFHLYRRQEMRDGSYAGWALPDSLLIAQYLTGHARAASASTSRSAKTTSTKRDIAGETCYSFNRGFCTTPCSAGRAHKCRKCSAADHAEKDCKAT